MLLEQHDLVPARTFSKIGTSKNDKQKRFNEDNCDPKRAYTITVKNLICLWNIYGQIQDHERTLRPVPPYSRPGSLHTLSPRLGPIHGSPRAST